MLDDAEAMDRLARALDAQGLDVAATAIRRLRLRVADVEARLDRARAELEQARAVAHDLRGQAQARVSAVDLALMGLLHALDEGDPEALGRARDAAREALGLAPPHPPDVGSDP